MEAARKSAEKVTAQVFESGFDEVSLTTRISEDFRKPNPPTAIIVSNGPFAAWAIRAFRSLKINYPRDVSLLAFDEPEWADIVTPRLSVVRQPHEAIARRAWEFLIRRMTNESEGLQREQLKADAAGWPQGEPLLAALRSWQGGHGGLVALVDGWELLTGPAPLGAAALDGFADGRGDGFAALAEVVGARDGLAAVREAGRAWALADLAANVAHAEERQTAAALATAMP